MESGQRCCFFSVSITAAGYSSPDLCAAHGCGGLRVVSISELQLSSAERWGGGCGRSIIMTASDAAASFRGEMERWRRPQRHYDCERCCMTFPGCEPTWQRHLTFSVFLFGSLSLCLLFLFLPVFLSLTFHSSLFHLVLLLLMFPLCYSS